MGSTPRRDEAMATWRDQLEASVAEHGTLASGPGTFAILPREIFAIDELPDTDPSSCTIVTEDGRPQLSIPAARPYGLRGGIHIVAPEHVAAIWQDLSQETLEAEYEHRCENDLPIPPVLQDAIDTSEVSDS